MAGSSGGPILTRRTAIALVVVALVAVLGTAAWVITRRGTYQEDQQAQATAIRAVDAEVRLALAKADIPVYEHQVAITCDEIRAAGSEPGSQGPGATMIVDGELDAVRQALAAAGIRTKVDPRGAGGPIPHLAAEVRRGGATVGVIVTGATEDAAGGITISAADLECT